MVREQGRFAGAVRADDHRDQPLAGDQIDAFEDRRLVAVAGDDALHLEGHGVITPVVAIGLRGPASCSPRGDAADPLHSPIEPPAVPAHRRPILLGSSTATPGLSAQLYNSARLRSTWPRGRASAGDRAA